MKSLDLPPATEGWMEEDDLAAMVGYACLLPKKLGGILEVGCYRGYTTCGLLSSGSQVTVVDTFRGGLDMPEHTKAGIMEAFSRNVKGRDVVVNVGKSSDILPAMPSGSMRLILVDGSHEYDDVLKDLRECWRILASGGYVFIDDMNWPNYRIGGLPTVRKAVETWMAEDKPLTMLRAVSDKLAYAVKP